MCRSLIYLSSVLNAVIVSIWKIIKFKTGLRLAARMAILVTGAAGFIGYHVAKALLDDGEEIVGVDDFNDYYDRIKDPSGYSRPRMVKLGVSLIY